MAHHRQLRGEPPQVRHRCPPRRRRAAGERAALIVGEGLAVVAAGCAIGIGVAQLALRALAPLVGLNQGPFDPLALAAVAVTMALVGAAASFAPARRASPVNPAVVLRHD